MRPGPRDSMDDDLRRLERYLQAAPRSMDDICALLDVEKSTVYKYFRRLRIRPRKGYWI